MSSARAFRCYSNYISDLKGISRPTLSAEPTKGSEVLRLRQVLQLQYNYCSTKKLRLQSLACIYDATEAHGEIVIRYV